jgi:hypothetical protein
MGSIKKRPSYLALILVCVVANLAVRMDAAPTYAYRPWTRITPSDGTGSMFWGNTIAMGGDTAVVGSRQQNGFGAVYVFVRSAGGWTQQARLTANDEILNDDFGYSVGISGEYIVVGAPAARPNGDPYRGAAYVFQRSGTTWTQVAKLVASDGASMDGFGVSVDIARGGQFIGVGAPSHAVGTNAQQGEAYFYNGSGANWSEQKVTRVDGAANDRFGWQVKLFGFDAVVTAPNRDVNGVVDQGQAYAYQIIGVNYTSIAALTAPDGAANNMFCDSVAINGPALGAVTIACLTTNADKVYIFQKSGMSYVLQTTMFGPAGSGFGNSLALGPNSLFIGNSSAAHAGISSGVIFQYNRVGTVWGQFPDLYPAGGVSGDNFGRAIAASGDYLAVTAPLTDIGANIDEGATYFFLAAKTTAFDFDGDNKSDVSVFRPNGASGGEWWISRTGVGTVFATGFGNSSDIPVPADLTGDQKYDIAFFRPSTGQWFVLRSEDYSFYAFPFGTVGDIPVPADYDGDGKADAAVYRPSTNTWFIARSSDGQTDIFQFGAAGDRPAPADYDGDGKADPAVFRPSGTIAGAAEWWIQRSTLGLLALQFGSSTDKAVPGDYTGDGKVDCAFYRPANGQWFVLRSEDFSYFAVPFGANGDIPAPGDYDGDSKTDSAVFRPSSGIWYLNQSTSGVLIAPFGRNGDVPAPSSYVR